MTPALEIIDARIEQFDRDTRAPRKVFDTIADFAANAGIVVGGRPVKPDAVDLRWVGALLYKNAVIEETGLAAAVLNHPATGVAWLANKIAPYGEVLRRRRRRSGRLVHPADERRARRCAARRLWPARQHLDAIRLTIEDPPMEMPVNAFKQALRQGKPQIGLWVGLADAYVAELLASTGFDWLVIDAEHSPNDPRSVLPQLQAMAPYPVHPIVRPVHGSVELIKQYLDIGAQTLIIPMVETAEQARPLVAATRYPHARHARRRQRHGARLALESDRRLSAAQRRGNVRAGTGGIRQRIGQSRGDRRGGRRRRRFLRAG